MITIDQFLFSRALDDQTERMADAAASPDD
jgi:hypothetical protein